MPTAPKDSGPGLLTHVLIPVANEADAAVTSEALEPYAPKQVTAVHVIEKAGGAPDKLSLEDAEAIAKSAFANVHDTFPHAKTVKLYERKVVDAIHTAASDLNVSSIAFCPRGGSRLLEILSGDRTRKLVVHSKCPVISLPVDEPEQ